MPGHPRRMGPEESRRNNVSCNVQIIIARIVDTLDRFIAFDHTNFLETVIRNSCKMGTLFLFIDRVYTQSGKSRKSQGI